jgi:hypothetical protein
MLQFVGLQMEQTCRLLTIPALPVTGSEPGVNKDQIGEQRATRRHQLYRGSTFFCSYLTFHPLYGEVPRTGMFRPSVCVTLVALLSWLSSHRLHNHCHNRNHIIIAVVIFVIANNSDSNHVSHSRPRHTHV